MKQYIDKSNSVRIFKTSDGHYFLTGNIAIAMDYFKQIHRKAPNNYGNFYGREKTGFQACEEIIKKFNFREI